MVRVVGVDPGTKSFDFCGLIDGKVALDESIPTVEVVKNPDLVVEVLNSFKPVDLIVGPSGFGLPLTHISRVGSRELSLLTLIKPMNAESRPQLGLRNVISKLKASGLNIYVIPGVKHLPTVPVYRKVNKVDMGTADKVCCAALALHSQTQHYNIDFHSTSFILVEIGFGYNAFIAVENGKIVDGIGGTLSWMGFLSHGSLDGELAYLLGEMSKDTLTTGGAKFVAGMETQSLEEFIEKIRQNKQYELAWEAFMEGIEKNVSSLLVSVRKPREIIVSGRLNSIPQAYDEISKRLSGYGKVRKLLGFTGKAKEAAQGGALIADGLVGGGFRGLVECLGIKEAGGSVLDHIYLKNIETVRKLFKV